MRRTYKCGIINDPFVYVALRAREDPTVSGTLFIISAPSGAGKTTLVTQVVAQLASQIRLERVITYTTKMPRRGERNSHDYHFVSREQFEQLLAQNFFIEYSTAYVDYYGSPASMLDGLKQGISYLLILDRVGAQKIVHKVLNVVTIWIETPSLAELKRRLICRGTDSETQIERRLRRAQEEMMLEHDDPFYEYHIVNEKVATARAELTSIIRAHILKRENNTPLLTVLNKSANEAI